MDTWKWSDGRWANGKAVQTKPTSPWASTHPSQTTATRRRTRLAKPMVFGLDFRLFQTKVDILR
ncbi:unnamed protein product [Ilex paraguariensis]|uniref:Uncharacterized protein n=1 Tax=Ilex paraguariensis TaxID=185542 RepID=A0ABC8RWK5_9AQUA